METNITLIELECPRCHLTYWVTKQHRDRLKETKETFYCPSGHPQLFSGKKDNDKYLEEKKKTDDLLLALTSIEKQINSLHCENVKLKKNNSRLKQHTDKISRTV